MPPATAATCVLAGPTAVLIRGASGAGKSRLALDILDHPAPFRFARLVGDDQVLLEAVSGRLLARPSPALAGRIELRGLGLLRLAHEPVARVGLVADLVNAGEAPRLPLPEQSKIRIEGVHLPRLALAAHTHGLSRIALTALAWLGRHDGLDAFAR